MASPAEGIKDLLVSEGIGDFLGGAGSNVWKICVGVEAADPATMITCYDVGGSAASPKWLLDYPHVQVRIRGKVGGYAAAFQKAKDCKDVLLGLPSQNLNGDRWVAINLLSDVMSIGMDDLQRPLFAFNLTLIIEPATSALTNRVPLT